MSVSSAGVAEGELRRGAGLALVGEHEGAGGEERGELGLLRGGDGGREGGAVEFGDLVLGRGQPVDERRLVGEQDQAGGVFIEAADAGDQRIAALPALGQEGVNGGAFAVVVRADQAEGFVDEQ